MVGQRKKLKQQFKDLMTVCYAEAKSPRAFNVSTDAPKSFLNKSLARVERVKNVSMYTIRVQNPPVYMPTNLQHP